VRTVTIIPPTGAGQPAIIFDENKAAPADACRDGFRPVPRRLFQQTDLLRGAAPAIYDRFNMRVEWAFEVAHFFTTQLACQDFIGNRPAIVRAGSLSILTRTGQGTFTRYYKSAFLEVCEPVAEVGISCRFRYKLNFNSLYSITP
jgi:hypothetical protein